MTAPELKKILYVEDEPDIQKIAALALEAVGGLGLLICSSGQEAIAKGPDYAPDLFLMDVMMPGMDGPTTLQHLRNHPALIKTPVIFMTAKVQPKEITHFMKLGAIDVIAKPFDPMTLADNIRKIWHRHMNL